MLGIWDRLRWGELVFRAVARETAHHEYRSIIFRPQCLLLCCCQWHQPLRPPAAAAAVAIVVCRTGLATVPDCKWRTMKLKRNTDSHEPWPQRPRPSPISCGNLCSVERVTSHKKALANWPISVRLSINDGRLWTVRFMPRLSHHWSGARHSPCRRVKSVWLIVANGHGIPGLAQHGWWESLVLVPSAQTQLVGWLRHTNPKHTAYPYWLGLCFISLIDSLIRAPTGITSSISLAPGGRYLKYFSNYSHTPVSNSSCSEVLMLKPETYSLLCHQGLADDVSIMIRICWHHYTQLG
jgi:hypothetical protein